MALKRIKAGESIRPLAIEKIKGSENDQFIAIISTDAICVDLIYINEFKTTFYFDDLMADSQLIDQIYSTGAKPRRLYILPCVRYSTQDIARNGKVFRGYGLPMELSYIAVTEFDYKEQIIGMINEAESAGANIMSYDIKVHTQKNGEFNQLKYTFASPNRLAWRESPQGEAMIREMLMEFDAKIELSLAMHVDVKTFIARWEREHPEFSSSGVQQGYSGAVPRPAMLAQPSVGALPPPVQAIPQPIQPAASPQYVQPVIMPTQAAPQQSNYGYTQPAVRLDQEYQDPSVEIPMEVSDNDVLKSLL